MAIYAIGDIQGCYASFLQLLNRIDFNKGKDSLWLTGDLVNRGPESLAVLRWVFDHQDCVQIVLGNHDLHLLAVYEGFGKVRRDDTLDDVLNAGDAKILLEWLRCQPLMVSGYGYAMVHAGLLPDWGIQKALQLAEEVEFTLSGRHYRDLLAHMYGNRPCYWSDDLKGIDRLRLIINAMTRLRFLNAQGEMDLHYKGTLAQAPEGLIPWFKAPHQNNHDIPILFGHWSALGLYISETAINLDSGCLWGGSLTAMRLQDKMVYSLSCPSYQTP